jgi:flagellar protein FlgJ
MFAQYNAEYLIRYIWPEGDNIMDISSVGSYNTSITQASLAKTEQNKAEAFQKVLNSAAASKDEAALEKACKEFETYFINYLFKQMQNSVNSINNGEGIIKKSQGEQIFTEMLTEEYSKTATAQGGIGLADMMYKQLSKNLSDLS